MKKFDQQKYVNDYKKENYKREYVEIGKETAKKFEEKCKNMKISKSQVMKKFINDFIEGDINYETK